MASCTLIKACEEFGVKLPTIKTDINSKSSSLVASSETKLKVCQKCIEFVKKYEIPNCFYCYLRKSIEEKSYPNEPSYGYLWRKTKLAFLSAITDDIHTPKDCLHCLYFIDKYNLQFQL